MRVWPLEPRFPPASSADDDGVVLVGGRMNPRWVIAAYRGGIFPWPVQVGARHVLVWFSPDPRCVFPLDGVHVSRRLARRINSGQYEVTFDQAFDQVLAGCAAPREEDHGTWITPELARTYGELHRQGIAHSVEVWHEGNLAGGLYGLAFGAYFSGESMFHRETDGSKIALVALVNYLRSRGFHLFDAQVMSPHLQSLGAIEIPRDEFLRRLSLAMAQPVTFRDETM